MSSQLCPRCLARRWEPALIGDGTLRCRACDFYLTEELAAELAKFNGAERELRRHRDAATIATEALVDAHQARELAERRAASWKLVAKRYRADAAEWRAAFEAAACMADELRGRLEWTQADRSLAFERTRLLSVELDAWRYATGARVPADLCDRAGSARVSSSASGFPGRAAPACKERDNMSGNNGMGGPVSTGAEGGTLNTGEPTQPKQAAPGRFPKTACHKLANGTSPEAVAEDGRDGSSVQCERNGTGVQVPPAPQGLRHAWRWPSDSCAHPDCQGSKLCEAEGCPGIHPNGCSADRTLDGWLCPEHAAHGRYPSSRPPVAPRQLDGSNTNDDLNADACEGLAEELDGGKLIPFAQALDAARSWARDWLDVYGQPSELWALLMRFAALVAMRPGERRRLDERHTFRLFESEPGGMLELGELGAGGRVEALVLPFGPCAFGRPIPEREAAELEATVRGAIQRVESLQAEAELFRHAATLIRGDCFSDRWTAGADFRDMAGAPLDGPHPDAYRFSLVGAMRQAWAERGGAGPVPPASLKRLVTLAAPACFTFKVEPATVEALQDVLRLVNDHREPGGMMRGQTAKSVLELLTRAALAADAEAESEVL